MQSLTPGVRTSPRQPGRRASTTAISLTVLVSLLLACAPPAPPAAPSAPAPTTAAAAKPAEASPQAAPAKPAAAAQPAASPATAAAPASGQIVDINESEPNTLVPKDVSSYLAYFVMNNIYDHVTARDFPGSVPTIVP